MSVPKTRDKPTTAIATQHERPQLQQATDLRDKMSEKYADDAQRQRVLFELMALCGSEELERATRLVEQGLAEQQGMYDPAQTVQLAQLVQEINAIPQARKNLHDTMQSYFKEMATERMVAIRNAVRQAWIAASLRSSQ